MSSSWPAMTSSSASARVSHQAMAIATATIALK